MKTDLFNPEYELALLKALICEPAEYMPKALKIVDVADFGDDDCRVLFRIISDLYHSGTVDIIAVKNKLKTDGIEYQPLLEDVLNSTATFANTEYYCQQIKDLSNQRHLAKINHNIGSIIDDNTPTTDKISRIQALTASIKPVKQAEGITAAQSLKNQLQAIIDGSISVVDFPFSLTTHLTQSLMPGTVSILCGNPGATKSFYLLQCLIHWFETGVKAAVMELEEDPNYWLRRLLAMKAGEANLTNLDWVKNNPEDALLAHSQFEDWQNGIASMLEVADCQMTHQQLTNWINAKARTGVKVIGIDPITALTATKKEVWIADNDFLQAVKRIAVDNGVAVLFVVHPIKAVSKPDMSQVAGSAAYTRFAQTILWLEAHEPSESIVMTACGNATLEHNRTLHILKSRNGSGAGKRVAYNFSSSSLCAKEEGLITGKPKKTKKKDQDGIIDEILTNDTNFDDILI